MESHTALSARQGRYARALGRKERALYPPPGQGTAVACPLNGIAACAFHVPSRKRQYFLKDLVAKVLKCSVSCRLCSGNVHQFLRETMVPVLFISTHVVTSSVKKVRFDRHLSLFAPHPKIMISLQVVDVAATFGTSSPYTFSSPVHPFSLLVDRLSVLMYHSVTIRIALRATHVH